jgi:hypothetical protein
VVTVGPAPELIIGTDAAGRPIVVRAVNVTVDGMVDPIPGTLLDTDGDGIIVVGDIYHDGDTGDIVMEAFHGNIGQANAVPVDGATGRHFWSTFYFWTSFDGVRIINDSDTDLNFEVEAYGRTKQAIDFAIAQLGDAYVYGGTGPSGWDCSGLVMKSFAAAGISLPRVVGPQMSAVRSISMDDLQPGDLVAYGDMSHIGIYLGRGKVIHAPRPGRSVEIHGVGGYSRAGRVG